MYANFVQESHVTSKNAHFSPCAYLQGELFQEMTLTVNATNSVNFRYQIVSFDRGHAFYSLQFHGKGWQFENQHHFFQLLTLIQKYEPFSMVFCHDRYSKRNLSRFIIEGSTIRSCPEGDTLVFSPAAKAKSKAIVTIAIDNIKEEVALLNSIDFFFFCKREGDETEITSINELVRRVVDMNFRF